MSGRPSNTASLPVEPHPLWLSSELARTSPPMFAYPFMGCLLRSPLPAPPPPSSRRSSSHRESLSPTLRIAGSSPKDRVVPGSSQMSALVQREYCQSVNPGQSPERYTVYERSRTSVPGLVDFTNTAPRMVSGLPKDPSRIPTNLDPHQPYPSPPKSRSDRSSAHTSSHSPQSSTTTVSRSSPVFVMSPGDIPLPLPSPSRRQPVSVLIHSRSLENHLSPNFKRRRTTSQTSPPHSSSSSMSSTRANRPLAPDRTSRKPNKHRAFPPLRPRSPLIAKPGLFLAEFPVPSPYKASIPDKDIYPFPPAVLPQEHKVTTERVVDHRHEYSLPQINQTRQRTLSSSKGHANISVGSLDLTKGNRPEHQSPQDVCLPSFELLLNGIQEMRMREQSGESTGMTIMDAV
ncbi:hypothetical protein [Phaffia rhodozyma]|uniref:Uncharacterized protein n=1 Tax=Phaffia rhodozyma TaxID=264483 RepID=A0A0F7SRY7_PHARH|nr:hypothetical protein [Phaffia rhodozyma]